MGGNGGKDVVAEYIYGLQQVGGHPAVAAVRGNQRDNTGEAGCISSYRENKQAIAQHIMGARVGIAVLAMQTVNPGYDVLHDSQWADGGAVDSPEYEREQDEECEDSYMKRQQSRDKLYVCQPVKPYFQRSGKVEEHKGDGGKTYDA